MSLERINKLLFAKEYSQEKKCFNLSMISLLIVYAVVFFECILLRFNYKVCISVATCAILTYTLFYLGSISEKYTVISFLSAQLFNLFLLPYIYSANRRFFTGVSIVFVFGMLYCVISMHGIMMLGSLLAALVMFIYVTVHVFYNYGGMDAARIGISGNVFFGQILNVILIGSICGHSVKKLMQIYDQEQEKTSEAVKNSELTSDAKDTFLSNMSHEIRTPMNAILGTSQLLLESDLAEEEQDKVLNILNSTNALLSSINDMLDISRIETGVIAIDEEAYDFSDMLTDIINMISVRVMDRGIEFLVDVDPDVPRNLYGDGKRVRQIFINILNNAVKYTKEGSIRLSIKNDLSVGENILLSVSVKDTGVGIKDEDKERLFGEFERLDTTAAGLHGVEGTGLGLSICREIIKAMGGDISFTSTYMEGTEFVFKIPQKIAAPEDSHEEIEVIGKVSDEFKQYKALIFEKSEECDEAITKSLNKLGIDSESAFGMDMFRTMMMRGEYSHIIMDRSNYYGMADFLKNHLGTTKLIVVTDINKTETSGCPGAIMVRPIYTGNLADYFAGKRHSLIRRINVRGNFTIPSAHIMTVDDNITNLNVVESILNKYHANVITATGGREALLKLENTKVDLIFLDYMMPEMDGVDTLKSIRAMDSEWTKNVPIVCLTANAIGGIREMLLSEGFDDYISKPIEVSKLERIMLKFLPEDLVETNTESDK